MTYVIGGLGQTELLIQLFVSLRLNLLPATCKLFLQKILNEAFYFVIRLLLYTAGLSRELFLKSSFPLGLLPFKTELDLSHMPLGADHADEGLDLDQRKKEYDSSVDLLICKMPSKVSLDRCC